MEFFYDDDPLDAGDGIGEFYYDGAGDALDIAGTPGERVNRLRSPNETEEDALTGLIRGEEASNLEEFFSIVLDENKKKYQFQFPIRTRFTLPGEEYTIDFILEDFPRNTPVEIDGDIGHSSSAQKAADRYRDTLIRPELRQFGLNDIVRISQDDLRDLRITRLTMRKLRII